MDNTYNKGDLKMQCQVCEKEYSVKLDNVEGLDVCARCQGELEIYLENIESKKVISGFPVYRKNRSTKNVHMNGAPACASRPYGQLPYHG